MSREANPELIEDEAFGATLRAMDEGVDVIDEMFGDGYAKKNPVLLGAFIQAYATNRMVCQLEPLGDVAEAVGNMESAVRDLEKSIEDRLGGIDYELNEYVSLARDFIEHRRERGNHGV